MDLALERQLWGYPGGVHDICVCCYHTGVSTCVMSVYSDQMGQVWARHTRRHGGRGSAPRRAGPRGARAAAESGERSGGESADTGTDAQTGERETRTPQSRSAESTAREWVARLTRTAGR